MSDHDDIEHIASQWIARRDRGNLSEPEESELKAWLAASLAHRVSFLRLNAGWARSQRMRALEHRDDLAAATTQGMLRLSHTRRLQGIAAAACLVLACAIGWLGWINAADTYRTAIGALQSVALADGSRITLNTHSAVHVHVSKRRREVELEEGEAFFEVAHDTSRPFLVRSGPVEVQVVGTQFAVYRTSEGVKVIVSEGQVRVHGFGLAAQDSHPTDLTAADIAFITASGIELHHASTEELEAALSWRDGMLIFRDTPLMDAVAEFNRYNATPIVVVDPELAEMRIGGSFRNSNAEGFLRLLQQGFDISTDRQETAVLLSQRPIRPNLD